MLTPTESWHIEAESAGAALNIVRLIYLDEAGRAAALQEPFFVRAAVIIHGDRQCDAVEEASDAIVRMFVPKPYQDNFEFHAYKLYSSNGKKFGNKERRWKILEVFAYLVERFKLPIVWGGIDKDGLAGRYRNPLNYEDLAFLLCAERTNWWFEKHAPQEKGLMIADRSEREANLRASLKEYRKVKIPWSSRPHDRLNHIVDTIHFVDSVHSRGVQLADACNFLIKRHLMGKKDTEPLFQVIAPQIRFGKLFPLDDLIFPTLCEACHAAH